MLFLNKAKKSLALRKVFALLLLGGGISGCAGTLLQEGEGKYIDAEFPDIRTVPSKREACKLRNKENLQDIAKLEREREKMKARDEALREGLEGAP